MPPPHMPEHSFAHGFLTPPPPNLNLDLSLSESDREGSQVKICWGPNICSWHTSLFHTRTPSGTHRGFRWNHPLHDVKTKNLKLLCPGTTGWFQWNHPLHGVKTKNFEIATSRNHRMVPLEPSFFSDSMVVFRSLCHDPVRYL